MPRIARLIVAFASAILAASCVESNRGMLEVNSSVDSVLAATGLTQSAYVGTPVTTKPTVVVKDANGFRVPGVKVTFVPGNGAGTVTGGEVVTDTGGRATVGDWIVGPDSGVDTLYATVIAGPTARKTRAFFTASVIDPCGQTSPYTVGTTITDTLNTIGCLSFAGDLTRPYAFTLASPAFLQFSVTSSAYPAVVDLVKSNGFPVALSDTAPAATKGTVSAYLAAGSYRVLAGSINRTSTGPFTLSSGPATLRTTCITNVFMTRNAVATGALTAASCAVSYTITGVYSGDALGDFFAVYVGATETVTIRAASTAFDTVLLMLTGDRSQLLAVNDNATGSSSNNSVMTFSPGSNGLQGGLYYFLVTGKGAVNGAYTVSVDP